MSEILTTMIVWLSEEECVDEKQVGLGPVMDDTFFGMASLGITDDTAVVGDADSPTEVQICGLERAPFFYLSPHESTDGSDTSFCGFRERRSCRRDDLS